MPAHGHGYDSDGHLEPGVTIIHNNDGKPEPVFTPEQWQAIKRAQDEPEKKGN